MARLDELISREAPGPARDTLLRIANREAEASQGQAAAANPFQAAQGSSPAASTTPASTQVAQATPAAPTAPPSAPPEDDGGFGVLDVVKVMLAATGIGIPIAFAIHNIQGAVSRRERAAAEAAANSKGLSSIQQRMVNGATAQKAVVDAFKAGELESMIASESGKKELEVVEGLLNAPMPHFGGPGTQALDANTGEPVSGYQVPFKTTPDTMIDARSSFALPPSETERQKLEAQRAYDPDQGLTVKLADLDRTIADNDTLLDMIEKAPDTGTYIESFKRYLSDRFGVDTGQNPTLVVLQAEIAKQNNALLNLAKGPQTDQDAQRIARTRASVGQGKEANIGLTITNKALTRRVREQEAFRLAWYEKNETFSGVEDEIVRRWGSKPLYTDAELAKLEAALGRADRDGLKAQGDLASLLRQPDPDPTQVAKAFRSLTPEAQRALPRAAQDRIRKILTEALE